MPLSYPGGYRLDDPNRKEGGCTKFFGVLIFGTFAVAVTVGVVRRISDGLPNWWDAITGFVSAILRTTGPWIGASLLACLVAFTGVVLSRTMRAIPRFYAFAEACFAIALAMSVLAPGRVEDLSFEIGATLLGSAYVMVRATDNWVTGVATNGWPRIVPGFFRSLIEPPRSTSEVVAGQAPDTDVEISGARESLPKDR